MSVNRATLLGHIGGDPEVRQLPSGERVAALRLATTQRWTDRNGKRQEATEWHRVILWGRLAELAEQYVRKGRELYVEGRLQTRQWQDQTGHKRYTTEVVATTVQLIGKRLDVPVEEPIEAGESVEARSEMDSSTELPPDVTEAVTVSWTGEEGVTP